MVDFSELKGKAQDAMTKAQDALADHADQIKSGIDKAGDFVAGKVGHGETVDKVEGALSGFVDKVAGSDGASGDAKS